MTLYHGTDTDFSEIDLRLCKPNKDFGKGFYLSDSYEQAQEMAKVLVLSERTHLPILLWNTTSNKSFKAHKMNIERKTFDAMVVDMTRRLGDLLHEERPSLSMAQILEIIYNSKTFDRLQDPDTQLYYQSPRNVYSYLKEEIGSDK